MEKQEIRTMTERMSALEKEREEITKRQMEIGREIEYLNQEINFAEKGDILENKWFCFDKDYPTTIYYSKRSFSHSVSHDIRMFLDGRLSQAFLAFYGYAFEIYDRFNNIFKPKILQEYHSERSIIDVKDCISFYIARSGPHMVFLTQEEALEIMAKSWLRALDIPSEIHCKNITLIPKLTLELKDDKHELEREERSTE